MTVDLLIENGTLVTAEGTLDASVAIEDETIVGIGQADAFPSARDTVDASDQLVLPGIVDPHVHINDFLSNDTHESATKAAAAGGITTIIDFAWQPKIGEHEFWSSDGSLLDGIQNKHEKAVDPLIDYGFHGVITKEDPAVFDELETVIEEGVTTFKLFTIYEQALSNGFMNEVFKQLSAVDAAALLHTEDPSVCEYLTEQFKAEGKTKPEEFPYSRPDYAEAMAAEDAVRMATEAGCKYYGIHTTSRKAADVLAQFRREVGSDLVRMETCTQYTTLDNSIHEELGLLPLITPPLREPDDCEAMFEHIDAGTLDVVSTDHAPNTRAMKDVDYWWESMFGIPGLQTHLPIFHQEAVQNRGYSYSQLVDLLSTTPAKLFGLPNKGSLSPGSDADIVLFDPNETYTITEADHYTNADYTVYEGWDVQGRVKKTFSRGTLVAEDGEIVGEPGHGKFIKRELPDWS